MSDYYADLDRARALGREYAENAIAAGVAVAADEPLSGMWAGEPTVADIIREIGGDPDEIEDFEREDIADCWEDGYFSANWPIVT